MSILSARFRYGLPLVFSSGIACIVACSSTNSDDDGVGGALGVSGTPTTAGVSGSGVGGSAAGAPSGGTGGSVAGAPMGGASSGSAGASAGSAGKPSTAGTGGAAAGSGGKPGGSGGSAGSSSGGTTATAGSAGAPMGGTGGGSSGGAFKLTSPSHMDGAEFAGKYTCSEKGFMGSLLPELNWTAVEGAATYAITFIDVTLAPAQVNGYHWGIYGIPASTTTLPEGMKNAMRPSGSTQVGLSPGDFLGPCPGLAGGGPDDYEFTIYALPASANVTPTGSGTNAVKDLSTKLEAASAIAKAKLTGTSNARQP